MCHGMYACTHARICVHTNTNTTHSSPNINKVRICPTEGAVQSIYHPCPRTSHLSPNPPPPHTSTDCVPAQRRGRRTALVHSPTAPICKHRQRFSTQRRGRGAALVCAPTSSTTHSPLCLSTGVVAGRGGSAWITQSSVARAGQ